MKQSLKNNILEVIDKHNLDKIEKQLKGSERFSSTVANNISKVREKLGTLKTGELDVRTVTAQDVCRLYHTMKCDYYSQHCYIDFNHINKSAIVFWSRVVGVCKDLDMTPDTYLKAQFTYFHQTFGTVPDVQQLITDKALERAKTVKGFTGRVAASAIQSSVPLPALFKSCDKQVRDICRAQKLTRKEFYQKLVLTGEFPMPVSFLEADPIYKEALDE